MRLNLFAITCGAAILLVVRSAPGQTGSTPPVPGGAVTNGGSATVVNEGRNGGTGLTVRVTIPLVPPAEPTPIVAGEDATLEPAPTS